MGRRVDANIVGVAAKLDSSRGLVVAPFEQLHRAVTGIGDIKHIGRGLVPDALRVLQSRDPADQFAIWKIDDANGVIAQFGNEQTLPLQVDGHVIDAATHVAQHNFGLELKRACIR
ncbi:hypothetical protein [Bradyrhizobium sp. AZCC 2289]|uniref:hypothetical protein n=1 Tax=Bradyrhizobium sp. AZCC 2289 TaxID=3117026 RepID=UPI002FEE873E